MDTNAIFGVLLLSTISGLLLFFGFKILFWIIRSIFRVIRSIGLKDKIISQEYQENLDGRLLNTNESEIQKPIPESKIQKRPSVFGEYSRYLYKKEYLMTKREAYFYRAIAGYLQDKDYIICPKVRVEDIIGIRSSYGFRPWKVSGRLDRSHIDFLLIGKTDLKNKFAIEVDDYSHDTFIGIERDNAKNEACAITGLPLIRFRDPDKIKEVFIQYGV